MARRRQHIDQQAAAIVNASLPSIAGINRTYRRAVQDNQGWTQGLVDALRAAGGGVAGAYDHAISDQRAIDQAAGQAIGAAGGVDAPRAALAAGGEGASAISAMLERSGALGGYAAKLPGIGALRGQANQVALQNQNLDTLTARREEFASKYPAVAEQLGQQRFQNNMALSQLQLQRDQMNQQAEQFNQSQQQQWDEFIRGLRAKTRAAGGAAALTPSQFHSQMSDAQGVIQQAIQGVPNPNYGYVANPNYDPNDKSAGPKYVMGVNPQTGKPWQPSDKWLVPPSHVNVIGVYHYLQGAGLDRSVILQAIRLRYPGYDFQHLLRTQLPGLYQSLYPNQAVAAAGPGPAAGGRGRQH